MSVYKKDTVIDTCAAWDVVTRDQDTGGFVNITVEDTLVRPDASGTFSPGSVVSYSLQYNRDPMKAVEDAKSRGQKLHWINANASVVSTMRKEKGKCLMIDFDQVYRFEGKLFKIVKTANNNLDWKAVEKD